MTTIEKNDDTVAEENNVSMTTLSAAALAAVMLALPAAPQPEQVPDPKKSEAERDLSDYKTYSWSREQERAENLANHIRIVNAIQKQMKEQNYRIDTIRPDLRIRYRLTLEDRVKGNATQDRSVWDNANSTVQIDFSREELAELSIELREAESRFLVWEAKGSYALGTPDRAEKQIREAVTDIFERYPTKE